MAMPPPAGLSRRRFAQLSSVGAMTAVAAVASNGARPLTAHAKPSSPPSRRSSNGWPYLQPVNAVSRVVEGTDVTLLTTGGAVAVVLEYVVRRLAYGGFALSADSVRSFSPPPRTVSAPFESNYASGTALAILEGEFPPGASGNLYPEQLTVVRDILTSCEGVIAWGGDSLERLSKEGHFQINVPPGDKALDRLAARLTPLPGTIAPDTAVLVDPFEEDRKRRASKAAPSQRAAGLK